AIGRVDRARGVRDDERADPEAAEDADSEDHTVGPDSLVEMRATAHDGHGNAADRAEHERARVTHRGRHGPARNLAIGDLDGSFDRLGEPSQAAPEDDAGARFEVRPLANALDGCVDLIGAHVDPSATRVSYRETTSSTASDTESVLSNEA